MPETVTLPCPDCDTTVTGPDGGKGSAAWKLGTHRARVHGYRSSGEKRVRNRAGDGPTAVEVLRDIGNELDTGKRTAPSVDELTDAFGRGLYTVSLGAASYLAETDPTCESEEDREAVTNYLSITARGARETMRPLGKALGRTKVNAKYGRGMVDNIDVLSSVTEVGLMFVRYRRYFRIRAAREVAMGLRIAPPPGAKVVDATARDAGGVPTGPGPLPFEGEASAWGAAPAWSAHDSDVDPLAPIPPGVGTVVADVNAMTGRVISAADVAEIRRRNGG